MANIVLLVGSYYPFFSAVGTCCNNIAEELVKNNRVTVVCMKSRYDQAEREVYRGQTIIRATHKLWERRLKLSAEINMADGLQWYSILMNAIRAKEYMKILVSPVSLNDSWCKAYLQALNDIPDPIDVIIPFCFPMESVVAAMDYKKKHNKVLLLPYLFDPFVDSHTLHRVTWNKHLKRKNNMEIEKKMISQSLAVFCVNQLQSHFTKHYIEHKEKIVFTEHPLLKEFKQDEMRLINKNNEINLTYTGVFDMTIRNPEYLLQIMTRVVSLLDAQLHLYSYGNCEHVIEKYALKANNRIIQHGCVSKEEANQAMLISDILICVGNIDNVQVPSKIFEYMSVGKPIIHLYTVADDVNVRILKDYPFSLCIKQEANLYDANVEKIVEFCLQNKRHTVDFEEVEKLYYYASPKYIAAQLLERLESRLMREDKLD